MWCPVQEFWFIVHYCCHSHPFALFIVCDLWLWPRSRPIWLWVVNFLVTFRAHRFLALHCYGQIRPHTSQATAAVWSTRLSFLAWRLASSWSSRCSSKDLTPDTVHCLEAVRFAARLPSQWQGRYRRAWNAWGTLCMVWLDVPVSLCLWLTRSRRVVWENKCLPCPSHGLTILYSFIKICIDIRLAECSWWCPTF